MSNVRSRRYAFSISAAAALLAGCGSNTTSSVVPAVNGFGDARQHSRTFSYTGRKQVFTVPTGVDKVTVIAVGARGGGDANYEGREIQALPGRAWAIVPVTPGEKLAVFVGGQGSEPNGGFNGGGTGGGEPFQGYGGGGASDVRRGGGALTDRIVVAGGGGGEEAFGFPEYGGLGGKGGGSVGGAGTNGFTGGSEHGGYGGGGGTQSSGGAGGAGGGYSGSYGDAGSPGSLGVGGGGGQGGGGSSYVGGSGGGGGGGYYGGGGGGGGGGYFGGGGGGAGGGSAYIEPSAYAGRTWRGWKIHTNNGLIVFDW
ncbi:MAG TPA: hypothetical protein VGI19_04340 [Candidatus Cybelea sp.]